MSITEEEQRSFGERLKTLHCPECDLEFTDYAVDWGWAWHEGRRDLFDEMGIESRDHLFKIKCELCGHRCWYCVFRNKVSSAENISASKAAVYKSR